MPVRYEPDYDAHIAYIIGDGVVTFDDCAELIRAQQRDVHLRLHEINDYRGVKLSMSAAESEKLARLNTQLYSEIHGIRFAVVTDSDLAYGLSRVFEAYLDDTVEYRIFTDYDEALAWIREAAGREGP